LLDLPILYEDEGQEDMGDSDIHTRTCDILFYGLEFHLAAQPQHRVFLNLNLHYSPVKPDAYLSPDIMAVTPSRPLPGDVASYRINVDGPAPFLVMEVLSERTFQQKDLTKKPRIYAGIGCAEYILVDVTGRFLRQRMRLKQRQPNGSWLNLQDLDGGVTSQFGFRLVIEADGHVRVIDTATGKRYLRPGEAQTAADRLAAETRVRRKAERAVRKAEERVRALEEELAQLRKSKRKRKDS
jgi:Uma2 family endonuclease